ncbi:Glycoside Hydrolase Family 131 protein [Mycena venus]|uniref:Glycoside Hydrolase Family 131 protein n=1 Tax=Mycena venus TaxID=2733690 RepID=A0A8H6YXM1_9AGAR|nr:Glycoside Hydrolase Family 131 protein [Mycena venus]
MNGYRRDWVCSLSCEFNGARRILPNNYRVHRTFSSIGIKALPQDGTAICRIMIKIRDLLSLFTFVVSITGSIIYDGRVPYSMHAAALDTSTGPFLTAVKGQNESASYYTSFLGHSALPTPLWNDRHRTNEQVISIKIDNTSIFVPGGGPPQYGFRRTELIAQKNSSSTSLDAEMETGVSVFHFSIKADPARPLNFSHEYQIVFIEPSDGTHVFGIQLGSPFTNPTAQLPAKNAHSFKVLDHALNVLFTTPFVPDIWHNFAITVDWENLTLLVAYSIEGLPLHAVTQTVENPTVTAGGNWRLSLWGAESKPILLALPLVNPKDLPVDQGDVVHHGIQEGTTEGLFYSGVFVEKSA